MIKNVLAPGLMLGAGLFGQASDLDAQETDTKSRTEIAELHDDPKRKAYSRVAFELRSLTEAMKTSDKEYSEEVITAFDDYADALDTGDERTIIEKGTALTRTVENEKISGIFPQERYAMFKELVIILAGLSVVGAVGAFIKDPAGSAEYVVDLVQNLKRIFNAPFGPDGTNQTTPPKVPEMEEKVEKAKS